MPVVVMEAKELLKLWEWVRFPYRLLIARWSNGRARDSDSRSGGSIPPRAVVSYQERGEKDGISIN